MANAEDFRKGMERIEEMERSLSRRSWNGEREEDKQYMSDMKNWLCVHVTRYMPQQNSSGKLAIQTTAMATDYELPRATVHVTINQVVHAHGAGSWNDVPFVVLAPYKDVVKENGNPVEVACEDTFFVPNPDTGLVLPESTCIVKPDNSTLFSIGDKVATYKTDNFTEQEIETILSFVTPYDRMMYENYSKGEVKEYEIPALFGYNQKLIDLYNKSKDKTAFIRGIFEEDRFVILTHFLRDAVVQMMTEKMGYRQVNAHEDEVSGVVADTAIAAGMRGNNGNKGHSASIEREIEEFGEFLYTLFISEKIDDIYDLLVSGNGTMDGLRYRNMQKPIIESILSDKVPDIYSAYKEAFKDSMDRKISGYTNMLDYEESSSRKQEYKKYIKYLKGLERGGLVGFNARLNTVLQRNSEKMTQKYIQMMNKLKQGSEYAILKQRLEEFVKHGRSKNSNDFMVSQYDIER